MPRPQDSVPRYRKHKASGLAVVTLSGKDHYLGPHGTKASRMAYDRLVGEWLANFRSAPRTTNAKPLAIATLANQYLQYAKSYYRRDGNPTSTLIRVKVAIRLLRSVYGPTRVMDFGPLALQSLQQRLVQEGKCRRYINHLVDQIKRVFKWGVSQQLLPVTVYQAIATVPGLRRGRSDARESTPIEPVMDSIVEQTLPHMPAVVADMVRFQRFTGCRPGDVCFLRPIDLDRSGDIWLYRPAQHKMEYAGKARVICIGPKAQQILRPYLDREPDQYCFSPAESEHTRLYLRHQARSTSLTAGNRPGTNRKHKPSRTAGIRYTSGTYLRAITRACEIAFGMPPDLRNPNRRLPAELRNDLLAQARCWRREHCWAPNRLRHSAGTEIRRKFGLEAAQVTLGHAHANVTQIYAERDLALAQKVMGEVG